MARRTEAGAAWASGITALTAEAGGALRLGIFTPETFTGLLLAAISGDKTAAALARLVARAVGEIGAAPKRRPKLCASCPRGLRTGRFAIVIATPARSDPTKALGMAVCEACASTEQEIFDRAATALRRVWPDLRPFRQTHETGGRA